LKQSMHSIVLSSHITKFIFNDELVLKHFSQQICL